MTWITARSYVIARDPVDPRALFDAAREVAGGPEHWTLWDGPDYGEVHVYRTHADQGAAAVVSVHFPAAGGPYPWEDPGTPRPDGYAQAGFTSGAYYASEDDAWRQHAHLVEKLCRWLDFRGIRWSWSFQGDPWIHGYIPATRQVTAAAAPDLGRRTARTAAAPAPAGVWQPLITATGQFEPDSDADLLAWMAGEAGGMTGYAEGVAAAYETAVNTVGLDPVAVEALHECAEAAAFAAEQMAKAREKFAGHYAEVRQFAAGGGVLPFNGRWMTGEGS